MVESELDIGGFESLAEFKKSVQQEKIRNLVLAEYMKTPIGKEPNRKTLSKNLKISEASISDAFRDVEKAKQDNDFSKAITKALGIATPMLLLQEENISKLSGFLNDNEELAAMAGGLYIAWNNFVKPRIDDPKNDLSELEVIVELFKSQVGQAFVGGIFGLLTTRKFINELLPYIDSVSDKVRDGFINFGLGISEVAEDVKDALQQAAEELVDIFGLNSIICLIPKDNKLLVFPNWSDWVEAQPFIIKSFYKMPSGIAAGIAIYKIEKTKFIEDCGKDNIVDYEQYKANPDAYLKPSEEIEEEERPPTETTIPPAGGGGGEEVLEQPKGTPERLTPGVGGSAPSSTSPIVDQPVTDTGQTISMGESVPSRGGIIKIEPESVVIKKI